MQTLFRWSVLLLACTLLAASCSPQVSTPPLSPTAVTQTTPTQEPWVHPPTVRDFVDPAGWYAIHFSGEMFLSEPQDYLPPEERWTSTRFSKEMRFLETGYLPYMSRFQDLCVWLANVELQTAESTIRWTTPCYVTSETIFGIPAKYTIYENPAADPDHRFFYIGASEPEGAAEQMEYSLTWLKGAGATGPTATPAPMDAEAAAFWDKSVSWRHTASFAAYPLPDEVQARIYTRILMQFVPQELRPEGMLVNPAAQEPGPQEKLKAMGYGLVETQQGRRRQMTRDGRLLFDYVTEVSPVYAFSTDGGPITAFVVNTLDPRQDGSQVVRSFLILNDAVGLWDYASNDPDLGPILYKGELLWLKAGKGSQLEVRNSRRDAIFTFNSYADPRPPDTFQGWGGHWILNTGDFLVQDGEILNETLGYQEIFGWSVFNDKPAYFFRKDTRLGLYHDGKYWPLDYEDILRGQCCGLESNNPTRVGDSMYFFARRDGIWYYVLVKFQ